MHGANGSALEREKLLARFYDLEYRNYREDLEFYRQYALAMDPQRELPVLELGCGTGRVLCALAEAGFGVVGVDCSEAMLEVCRERVGEVGASERVTLVRGDMRDLRGVPTGPYNMALCALNTFAYLGSTEDQLAMLGAVRGYLVQHGLLILDLTPPMPHLLVPSDGEVLRQGSYRNEDGTMVHKSVSGTVDHSTQMHRVTVFYDEERAGGSVRVSEKLSLRWTGRYEMELVLERAGYHVEKVYGGYDLEEFDADSERMIFVARI